MERTVQVTGGSLVAAEGRLVVDRVEHVLGEDLVCLVVGIPQGPADVRLAGRVAKDVRQLARVVDVEARSPTEDAARGRKRAATGATTARAVGHVADLRQIDLNVAERTVREEGRRWLDASDLATRPPWTGEEYVECRRQVLGFEHRIARSTTAVRKTDFGRDVARDISAARRRAQILERSEAQ